MFEIGVLGAVIDGRNDVEEVGREREVAGDEVEGTDQSLGLVDVVEALKLSHGPWRE